MFDIFKPKAEIIYMIDGKLKITTNHNKALKTYLRTRVNIFDMIHKKMPLPNSHRILGNIQLGRACRKDYEGEIPPEVRLSL